MFRRVSRLALALWLLTLIGGSAHAEALPHAASYALGRPRKPVPIKVSGGAALTIELASKVRKLPVAAASEIAIELVEVAPDGAVAIVRVRSPDGPWVGVVGGRSGSDLLLFESSAPQGDPGERRTREVRVGDPVLTGIRREGLSGCGDRPYLFEARRLDPSTLTFVTAEPFTVPQASQASVTALTAGAPAPRFAGLHAVSSSEIDGLTQMPRAPRAWLDADANSVFALRPTGLALLRWEGGPIAIERLQVDVGASAKPIEIALLGDGEAAVRATLPPHAAPATFEIPAALKGRCLAIAHVSGPALELRELRAYSELDGAGGVAKLIGLMVQDDAHSAEAAELLTKLGPDAAEALAARFDELPARGRRRSLKAFAGALDRSAVRARVVALASGDDGELRELALGVLDRGGEAGHIALRELAMAHTAAGDSAALTLAKHADELPALLAALATPEGPSRPSLRQALLEHARRHRASFEPGVAGFRRTASTPAIAALTQAIATVAPELAAAMAEERAIDAGAFEVRYRFAVALRATKRVQPGAVDGWLVAQAAAEEWMQRRAALEALVARGAPEAALVAEKLAGDPYPRVRAATLGPLLALGQRASVERSLAHDSWPLVRAEAARSLAADAAGHAALDKAVDDHAPSVRRAAIESLTAQRSDAAWPHVSARLRDARESLLVREAAINYARELCVQDAREPLLTAARLVLGARPTEDEMRLGVEALRALRDLGGDAAQAGSAVVKQAAAPELDRLYRRLPPPRCEVRHES